MTTIANTRQDLEQLAAGASPCPTWCTFDHEAEDRRTASAWAEHGHIYTPDADVHHSGVTFNLGTHDANERRWAQPSLIRDGGETRIYLCDELELTMDTAEQLLTLLPGLIARGRGA
jgi:hypothetical protein